MIKERIIRYVDTVELLIEEIKQRTTNFTELEESIKKQADESLKKEMAAELFANIVYTMLLNKELSNIISRISELYILSVTVEPDVKYDDLETKVLKDYVKQAELNFVVDKGKLKSKEENLFEKMQSKATTISDSPMIEQYLTNFIKK